jgi:hypothetical protein
MSEMSKEEKLEHEVQILKYRSVQVGDYGLFDSDDTHIGIFHVNGEGGLFKKKEFEAYVAAFFGLNF